MNIAELIRRKRDRHALAPEEIAALVGGIVDGSASDAQVAAFAMAAFLNGLDDAETVALTRAMTESGTVLEWPELERPVLDKHSTGGVGDKVSLMLAPIVAARGGAVPMISGRGLGHTGGTLDKLDAIAGYDTAPGIDRLRAVVAEAGCAIIGQTPELAPADRRLYAIRDATGTVESIPMIVASILSKKLAAGLDALVLDVKFGSGAFMASRADADELARALVDVANGAGLPCQALLTDMDDVLGTSAGNAVEVAEAIDYLTSARRDPRLHEVTMALCRALADEPQRALDSGAAAERFAAMVAALGGPADLLEHPGRHLPAAPIRRPVHPERAGIVRTVDVRAVGLIVTGLGGGRRREDDAIDHAVGLTEVAPTGAAVGPDHPLAIVHARTGDDADQAAAALRKAVTVGDEPPPERPVVAGRIGS